MTPGPHCTGLYYSVVEMFWSRGLELRSAVVFLLVRIIGIRMNRYTSEQFLCQEFSHNDCYYIFILLYSIKRMVGCDQFYVRKRQVFLFM